MLKTYRKAVCDTSCLILLNKIDYLWLLRKLFAEVYISPVVETEFLHKKPGDSDKLKEFFLFNPDKDMINSLYHSDLGAGEASAMAIAKTIDEILLVIDDLKARKVSRKHQIPIIGTLGLFPLAKNAGIISSVEPLLKKVKKTDFRLSIEIEIQILKLAGEL